jgi:PPP family 3-phenylpropionic acid transporter
MTVGTARTAAFAALQFFFWSAIVSFEAFLVPWLTQNGYSPAAAGRVFALVFAFAIVGQPLMGGISDRVAAPGRMVTLALVIGSLAFLLVRWFTPREPILFLLMITFSLTISSLPAVLDGWVMRQREQIPDLQFGVARGIGSFGFAAGGLILGVLVDRTGIAIVFPIFALLGLVAAVIAARIPRVAPRGEPDGRAARTASRTMRTIATDPFPPLELRTADGRSSAAPENDAGALRAVLSNKPYLTLIAGAFLGFSGLRAALTYIPFLLESVGGTVGQAGLAHSIGALSEIPFFVAAALLHRFARGPKLISAVLLLLAVRLVLYSWVQTPGAVLALQLMHGVTFGIFMATAVDYIHEIAPPRHRGFFQALAPSLYFGLGSVTGSFVGGMLLEATSLPWLYRAAALIALIGAPLPLWGLSSAPPRPTSHPEQSVRPQAE